MILTELRFRGRGRPPETSVRIATAADFYAYARDELAKARACVELLVLLEGWGERDPEAIDEGLELLVEHLVNAAEWREHARRARAASRA